MTSERQEAALRKLTKRFAPVQVCACGRTVFVKKSGECKRCYDRRWWAKNRAVEPKPKKAATKPKKAVSKPKKVAAAKPKKVYEPQPKAVPKPVREVRLEPRYTKAVEPKPKKLKKPPFDASPYDGLVKTAALHFLTDTHYAIDIAKAAGRVKDRRARMKS